MSTPEINFRLQEFKAIGKWLDHNLPLPFAFILKGLLMALEERYIDVKVQSSVDEAIAAYSAAEEPLVKLPEFYEEESGVEGLPTIGIRAPYEH